jgi:dephospho-CoA kinase
VAVLKSALLKQNNLQVFSCKHPPLIGLTGGIGSGKSAVASILNELGCIIVDADAISRSTTAAGGCAMVTIASVFGASLVGADGALDRIKMRDLVFSDPAAKTKLEAIVHPLIRQTMQAQIDIARQSAVDSGSRAIVLDLPLLAEKTTFNGWRSQLDAIWVVDCSETTQVTRVMARSGMTEAQVRAVMDNQASRADRRRIADVVITNDGCTLSELKAVIITASHFCDDIRTFNLL